MARLGVRRPHRDLVRSYVDLLEAMKPSDPSYWSERRPELAAENPARYVAWLNGMARGVDLPEGWPLTDTFWIVDDGIVVGVLEIRQSLTPQALAMGGHGAIAVHPDYRNKGVGAFGGRQALAIFALLGLAEIVLTCPAGDRGAVRMMEALGGTRLDDVVAGERTMLQYRIATPEDVAFS